MSTARQRLLEPLKGVFKDTVATISEAQLPLVASSLSYTTILSIIPVLAMSFSIFKAFGNMESLYAQIEPYIISNLTQGASVQAQQMIKSFIGNIHAGALGVGGFFGLILTCFTMFYSVEKHINRIWKSEITRSRFNIFASYWVVLTLGPVAAAFVIGLAGSKQLPLTRFLPDSTGAFLMAVAILSLIYKGVPNRKVHWIPAIASGIFAAIAWNFARLGYAAYTSNVVSYNKIYGSLAAIPILLLWIYIVWLVILTGAALTASIQRRFDV